jgi:hypothetical protein
MSCMFLFLFSSLFHAHDIFSSYQMFEVNMDEYLDEEVESVKLSFQVICRDWAAKVTVSKISLLVVLSKNYLS